MYVKCYVPNFHVYTDVKKKERKKEGGGELVSTALNEIILFVGVKLLINHNLWHL